MAKLHARRNHVDPRPDSMLPEPDASVHHRGFFQAIAATALFRCWHFIFFFTIWAAGVQAVNKYVTDVSLASTLLTVVGTMLGFVISYRTSASFDRYNAGRAYWSQIVLACRTFARSVWFHIPDDLPPSAADIAANRSPEEIRARTLIEKKTVINLVLGFSVAVKHYLRGEDEIDYVDLYHLVKYLPVYSLPSALPSADGYNSAYGSSSDLNSISEASRSMTTVGGGLPMPVTMKGEIGGIVPELKPARNPPPSHFYDVFPFSLIAKALIHMGKGKNIQGKKAAKLRARMHQNHNVPLEISLYLSSYIAAMQARKSIDGGVAGMMMGPLNSLVDALTGLERILTTPMPFSYEMHLWLVTGAYCLLLPFQLVETLDWFSIPATSLAVFIFFGFLVAGEEIENPFGYDKNDLNLDHFTHNIIRKELLAITSVPAPDPTDWAFSAANDYVFATRLEGADRATPNQWVQRGYNQMQSAMTYNG